MVGSILLYIIYSLSLSLSLCLIVASSNPAMSLVDYSSDEDDADDDKETETDREPQRADIERKGTARFLPSSSPSPSSPSIRFEIGVLCR